MPEPVDILIIDDDEAFCAVLARACRRRGLNPLCVHDGDNARRVLAEQQPPRVLLDLKLGEQSGLALIEPIRQLAPQASIVILTGYSSIATAVEAVKLGATHYLCKPARADDILAAFDQTSGDAEVELSATPHSVDRLEWEHIQRVLNENQGNISATARALGMHRRTLQRKLQKRPVKH